MRTPTAVRIRRWVALGATVLVPFALVRFGGHKGVHSARNLLVRGAGLIDERPLVGIAFVVLGIAATVLWLRWGADWTVATVLVAAMVVSAVLTSPSVHRTPAAAIPHLRAAHEFPLVVLVLGALSWLRTVVGRVPGLRRLTARRHRTRSGIGDVASLRPVDRCRTVALLALAGAAGPAAVAAVTAPDVASRSRRIGLVARFRTGGDPFRRDHAPARAALALTGQFDAASWDRFAADAARAPVGVPCSEPGWVRLLDGTLAALALARGAHPEAGRTWALALRGPLSLHRGHRPAWWWTPLAVGAGSLPPWEHAAGSALAHAAGWLGPEDWAALRAGALGAAARGGDQPDDERMIAAARIWLALVDDPEAARIVSRPGVRRDPLACALDAVAHRLGADPRLLTTDGAASANLCTPDDPPVPDPMITGGSA